MHLRWLCLLVLFIAACEANRNGKAVSKPNILILLADDMGWADLACYGGKAHTPNLDRLAVNGFRFTDFYAAAPNCSPSRVGLMTGKSPAIVGMYNYRSEGHPMHLREEEITLAEILQDQGYATAHIGKWHLGCLPQDSTLNHPQPDDQGFDYSLGTENNAKPSHLNPTNFVRNGVELPPQNGYSCQLLADEFIAWHTNRSNSKQPFFSYLAFHEPHAKIASPPDLVAKYDSFPAKDAEYLANIENLDLAVGRILDYLEENQLLDNTIILFASDNGSYRQASNGPLRAKKSYVYEGGIRVPGIFHWPALKRKNVVVETPAGLVDVLPTLCDILEVEPSNQSDLDGTSFYGLLQGEELDRTKPLFWYFYRTSPEMAMRIDELMLIGKDVDTIPRTHRFSQPDMDYIKTMDFETYEIYHLRSDIGQYENQIAVHPQAKALQKRLDNQLLEIQKSGYLWDSLPAATDMKRVKTKWVRYKR